MIMTQRLVFGLLIYTANIAQRTGNNIDIVTNAWNIMADFLERQ